jgi:CRP/FNR family cyclic AMP-dependent transcriptional regulator
MKFIWSSSLFKKDKDEEHVMEALKKCFLFESLTPRELAVVRKAVHVRRYNVGENVFQQHQPGTGVYIIVNGKVGIETEKVFADPKTRIEKSDVVLLETLVAGDFFGELALVEDESVRTATAKIIEPSLLIGFFKPDFIEIMNIRPATGLKLSLKLAQVITERVKQAVEEIHRLRLQK